MIRTVAINAKPRAKWLSTMCTVTIAMGVAIACAWAANVVWLKQIVPGQAPVEASTAMNLIVTTLSVWWLAGDRKIWQRSAKVLALVMLCCSAVTLFESVTGNDLGTTITLFSADQSSAGLSYPGPMAPIAATLFSLVALAVLLCDFRVRRDAFGNEAFGLFALAVGLTTLVGNSCGANRLCTPNGCIVTTLPTSLAFVAASILVLSIRPQRGLVRFVTADTLAGTVMRRALAGAIVFPALLWMRALGETAGWYDAALGWSIFAVASVFLIASGFMMSAKALSHLETADADKQKRLLDSSVEISALSRQLQTNQTDKEKRLKNVCLDCGDEFDLSVQTCSKCGAGLARLNKKHFVGETFAGKFELKDLLGEGGMSTVYKAENLALRKVVALKVLNSRLAADKQAMRRLQQEAKTSGLLKHRNLVDVFDFGITEDGEAYIVMELLNGTSLGDLIAVYGRMKPYRVTELLEQVCAGLQCAHEHGIVHRDLKPSNIILLDDGSGFEAKIVDFGIACDLNLSDSQRLTATGELIGSPSYMSPEQCAGHALDARSDIYSLGCLIYETLAGRPPFVASNVVALLNKHLEADPDPLNPELQIPNILETAVLKALSKRPEDRFQTAREFANAVWAQVTH